MSENQQENKNDIVKQQSMNNQDNTKAQEENTLQKSEQIGDIVERMPTSGVKWILLIVLFLVSMMLLFGFIIRYPEVVSGSITITTQRAPVTLVSKTSGRLQLLNLKPRMQVSEGDVFAMIYNNAQLKDILKVDSLLTLLPSEICLTNVLNLPEDVNLGDLNGLYYSFIDSYKKRLYHEKENTFDTRLKLLNIQTENYTSTLNSSNERLRIKEQQLAYYQREVTRDSTLWKLGGSIEREWDRTQNTYNSMLENLRSYQNEIISLQIQLKSIQEQITQTRIERRDQEQQMQTNYMASLNNLQAGITQWKEQYTFITPISGIVEFHGFWRENDFIMSGKDLFSIIPNQNDIYGHMVLPSFGAGKVKKGQLVIIQLNDYPSLEFGSIKGVVSDISLITNQTTVANASQPIDSYLLTVSLPDGLRTKFGTNLDFRNEIKGLADIQTRKRRLAERLFDNLKYITQD